MARPIPEPAPVTMACLPFNRTAIVPLPFSYAVVSIVGRTDISDMCALRGNNSMKTIVWPISSGFTAPSLATCA
jgi:hypothetical protein